MNERAVLPLPPLWSVGDAEDGREDCALLFRGAERGRMAARGDRWELTFDDDEDAKGLREQLSVLGFVVATSATGCTVTFGPSGVSGPFLDPDAAQRSAQVTPGFIHGDRPDGHEQHLARVQDRGESGADGGVQLKHTLHSVPDSIDPRAVSRTWASYANGNNVASLGDVAALPSNVASAAVKATPGNLGLVWAALQSWSPSQLDGSASVLPLSQEVFDTAQWESAVRAVLAGDPFSRTIPSDPRARFLVGLEHYVAAQRSPSGVARDQHLLHAKQHWKAILATSLPSEGQQIAGAAYLGKVKAIAEVGVAFCDAASVAQNPASRPAARRHLVGALDDVVRTTRVTPLAAYRALALWQIWTNDPVILAPDDADAERLALAPVSAAPAPAQEFGGREGHLKFDLGTGEVTVPEPTSPHRPGPTTADVRRLFAATRVMAIRASGAPAPPPETVNRWLETLRSP